MDQQTLELLKALQSSDRDAAVFEQIQSLLVSQRSQLVAEDDRATLADLSELLEVWAETATPAFAAAATAHAAQIAEEDLEQAERAVQLYVLSLEREPTASDALTRLDALLCRRGERERLESILAMQAKALRERAEGDPERAAAVLRRLGELRAERGGDLNSAIEAYEQALDLAADPDTIRALADLYSKRNATGDAVQAADLYCTLGDVMGPEEGAPMLERALEQVPAHDAALDLLETYVPPAEQASRLKQRWSAYIEGSDNESGVDKRRLLLSRAHASGGAYRDALICLGPLVDKGEPEALSLQAAFLANLHDEPAQSTAAEAAPAAKSGNGKPVKRPATLVGFRLPPGEGVPDVAEPPPPQTEEAAARDQADDDDEEAREAAVIEAVQFAASARNAFAARSGETLVGFRVPPTLPGGAGQAPSADEDADEGAPTRTDANDAVTAANPMPISARSERTEKEAETAPNVMPADTRGETATSPAAKDAGAGARSRKPDAAEAFSEPGTGERPRSTAEPAQKPAARADAGGAAQPAKRASKPEPKPARATSGTYAAAAARASSGGPGALSAALAASRTSPGTQRAAARGSAPAASARSMSTPAQESPAAKAAALKASRTSSMPPDMASAPKRSSSPPPLKRRISGPTAAAAAAAQQSAPMRSPAAFAATMPMQLQAQAQPMAAAASLAAAEPIAFAESVAAVDPAAALAAQSLPVAAPVLSTAPLAEAFGVGKRKRDPRWLIAGGVAATAVILGVIMTSGEPEPSPAADARVEATPGATAPAATPTPAPPVPASPTPAAAAPGTLTATTTAAAPATAPAATTGTAAPATNSALAAAVAPAAATAPAPAAEKRSRRDVDVTIGDVRVRGGQLAVKAVTSALDEGLSKIESCYTNAVERKRDLEGRLTFAFSVDKTGKAGKVRKQSGTIKDAALIRCSTEAIQKTRFPKPKKRAAQITLPLTYER